MRLWRVVVLGVLIYVVGLASVLGVGSARAEEATYPVGITGLPDGRLYEQVTPPFKNGNFYNTDGLTFGLASADGDAVLYPMTGAVGLASSGLITEFASTRTPGVGWQTVSTTPRATSAVETFSAPRTMVPSLDFKRFLFASSASFVAEDPVQSGGSGVNLFISEDPLSEPTWVGRPTVSDPIPALGQVNLFYYAVAGASPSLDTVYFTSSGTLTAQDASRAPNVAPSKSARPDDPWGFYEWSLGSLVTAGVLPDGHLSAFGAVPAAIAGQGVFERGFQETQAETMDNEVSEDGSRAFFVSPDPAASTVSDPSRCALEPPCTSEAPELYVREPGAGGERVSVLVSRSELPGHEGEAAADGVVSVPYPARERTYPNHTADGSDMFGSPDGSHVFFASTDRLTVAAPEDATVKEYDYDLETGSLTYLPGVSGPIAVATRNGSELLFEDRTRSPWNLELWRDGANGGSVTQVTELPETFTGVSDSSSLDLSAVHVSNDGSVFVFRTNSVIPGGFNNSGETEQVYRYEADVPGGHIDCVSCPPSGIAAPGEARMSYNNAETGIKLNGSDLTPKTTIETRGMSADGSRVFFDTPAPLVAQDTNGTRDVYEWENGKVYLISSGTSPDESEVLDNSESGGDVFFATTSELVAGDADGAGDVYDARIPRPGDDPPPTAVPCKGSVCQGPPSVPNLLGAPASATFSGVGNLSPSPGVKPAPKKKTPKKKAVKRKKGRRRHKRNGKSAHGRSSHRRGHVAGPGQSHSNGKGLGNGRSE